ncbi:MAG: ComF family protein [Acidimicrobiales bacterium]
MVFAVGVHCGARRHALGRYKYLGERWWADVFARSIARHLEDHATWFEDFDFIVPMPSYIGCGARRAWDPVGELAARLESLVAPRWDLQPDAIVKRAETPAMRGRPWSERQAIAAGPLRRALAVPSPALVDEARILVLDDVLTEGGTLREVARALRLAGAREVAGLVLARPVWYEHPPAPGRR